MGGGRLRKDIGTDKQKHDGETAERLTTQFRKKRGPPLRGGPYWLLGGGDEERERPSQTGDVTGRR